MRRGFRGKRLVNRIVAPAVLLILPTCSAEVGEATPEVAEVAEAAPPAAQPSFRVPAALTPTDFQVNVRGL